jgi:hypothetical protein
MSLAKALKNESDLRKRHLLQAARLRTLQMTTISSAGLLQWAKN